MITDSFIRELEEIVGKASVSVSRANAELYSYDASLARGKPGVVVFPADSQEVARVVRAAHKSAIPFVPRGFGTNLSGGTIVTVEGLVVCLSRLNRILGIYPESRYAVVQPGVTNLELQDALATIGFFYAPDPASQKVSTIGGNAGENSGGPRCLKYGVTTNHILGLEMIMPDGEVVSTGGAALDPPGYDLRGAVVGGEGTLGVVTEITVRILPLSESIITMLATYDSIADAAISVSDIISSGILPTTLEMMDAMIIKAVEDSYACGYPRDAAAVLIIEVEGPEAGLKEQAQRIQEICMQTKCREIQEAKNNDERNRLWQGRRGAFGAVARLAPNYLVNDATVPRTKLPEALAAVAAITEKYNCEHGNVFHAGDGNLHPLLLFDSRDTDQLHRVEKAGWEIMEACVKLGGTISGEHGIGLEKQEAMRLVFSEDDFHAQRALKQAFDPGNILNPGKIIPPPKEGGQNGEPVEPTLSEQVRGTAGNGSRASEIMDAIKNAAAHNRAVVPTGSGTFSQFGNLPNRETQSVSSLSLADVIEYDPPNQVITVGAGMSLAELQDHLKANNQWLPVRPPFFGSSSTIGSLVAMAASGPERMAYGAPRDLLLGLRYIDSRGRQVTAGGRVVKNVAGYDMTRLITGSAGTLGFISEATWRVSTIPERCAAITATGSLDACAATAIEIVQSKLSPIYVTCLPDKASGDWKLVVGFEGFSGTVDYQLKKCSAVLDKANLQSLEYADYPVHTGRFGEVYDAIGQSPFILRADLPLDRVAGVPDALDGRPVQSGMLLDFGCGRILAGLDALGNDDWMRLSDLIAQRDGHCLLIKAPDDFRKDNDVFGSPRTGWRVMHSIKAALDPDGIFAPGCLPGKV
ncbi:MAG: FAD-linked oxidase C-terminal domain-containing protein [Deltaproteobacteria bacterium]|nr:FAD-linked oxidase C-terminal domain-containing protein [Deltaproteobacteria bacterium]